MNQTVQSVDRALLILQILENKRDGLGVTEIAHRLGVAKSTTHRLLSSLHQFGFVQKDNRTEKYKLGLKLLELGTVVTESLDIRKIAEPYLRNLTEETGETAHLVILEQSEIVYIDKIESNATIGMKSRIGKRAPVYCTGVGKAMLSHFSDEDVEEIIGFGDMKKYTVNTITDPALFQQELKQIRKKGYALDLEEHEEGIRCVAAGILNYESRVVAGISIAGPVMRMTKGKLDLYAEKVTACALEISRQLGYQADVCPSGRDL